MRLDNGTQRWILMKNDSMCFVEMELGNKMKGVIMKGDISLGERG